MLVSDPLQSQFDFDCVHRFLDVLSGVGREIRRAEHRECFEIPGNLNVMFTPETSACFCDDALAPH